MPDFDKFLNSSNSEFTPSLITFPFCKRAGGFSEIVDLFSQVIFLHRFNFSPIICNCLLLESIHIFFIGDIDCRDSLS